MEYKRGGSKKAHGDKARWLNSGHALSTFKTKRVAARQRDPGSHRLHTGHALGEKRTSRVARKSNTARARSKK